MSERDFSLCYITDRKSLPPGTLLSKILEAVDASLPMIQIREKDLGSPELLKLTRTAVESSSSRPSRILVNDRLDIALASGADGVHLGGRSAPLAAVRAGLRPERRRRILIGVSCHSLEEAQAAEQAEADYILLGPIFEPFSKTSSAPVLGLEGLRRVCNQVRVPVLALGGISVERIAGCREAGAQGVAGISLFQTCPSLLRRMEEIRGVLGSVRL
jgi:thiamine-phosphate pyrophosphorylase